MRIVHSAKQKTKDVNKRLFLSPIGSIFERVAANTYNKIIIIWIKSNNNIYEMYIEILLTNK